MKYIADLLDRHWFVRGDGFVRSSLPLNKGDVFFVLPDEGVSVDSLFDSETRLQEVMEEGTKRNGNVNLKIPVFTISSQLDIQEMVLNRPFLFGIKSGDVWLFIGVCDNPSVVGE